MMKTIFERVMWLARGTSMVLGLAVMLALVMGVATMALAAVPGDPFKLGKTNTIDKLSKLVGSVDDAMLRIDNNNAGANATALDLRVEPGNAPMTVDGNDAVVPVGTYKVTANVSVPNDGQNHDDEVLCDSGDVVLGGGFRGLSSTRQVIASGPFPIADDAVPTGWLGSFRNTGAADASIPIDVVCADLGEPHT